MSSFGRWGCCLAGAFALLALPRLWADSVADEIALERGLPVIRNFPPRAYAGRNQVWAAAAAHDGTLFFGGLAQVHVFDGVTWTKISVPNGAFIRALAVDANDVVWVGGVDEVGRIQRDVAGRWRYESLRGRVPASVGNLQDIWSVFATDQGVWFQSNKAVIRWRNDHFDSWMMNERAIVLSFWLKDRLLVARLKGWYEPGPNGAWVQVGEPGSHLGDYLPHFSVPHPDGGWLMGIEGPHGEVLGLARWDGAKLTFETHPLDAYFKAKRFYSANRLSDGRYLITTLQGGALLLGPHLEFQTLLDQKAGIASDAVISALEDSHHALWLCTEFGISRVETTPAYAWFGSEQGLGREMHHLSIRWNGHRIFATSKGLVHLAPATEQPGNSRFEPWSNVDDKVYTLEPIRDGILVGALSGIWWVNSKGQARKITSHSNAFEFTQSHHDATVVYCASLNGIISLRWKDGDWVRTDITTEVTGSNLYEAADGTLWVGTDNHGFERVTLTKAGGDTVKAIRRFGADAGLPNSGAMFATEFGGQPLFCTQAGFFRFDSATEEFRPDDSINSLVGDSSLSVRKAQLDPHNRLWLVVQPTGSAPDDSNLTRFGYVSDGEWHALPLPDLERIGGFEGIDFENFGGHDLVWYNGQSSIVRVDLTTWSAGGDGPIGSTVLNPVVTTDGQALSRQSAAPRVPAAQNSLHFSFGTPGLAGEPDVRHESRLIGFGNGAVELTSGGERTFTNLPAGHYTFEVRGRSADGRWSEPARQEFIVLAPWWQTTWAWLGYVGLALAGTYGIVRRRTRVLEQERQRLERVVAERTTELASKNRELERLNRLEKDEKLAARLAEEKAQLELLRYQLNPHFLFNSLNSIRALVYAKPEAAGEMVSRLAEFCRWTLTRGSDEITTVAEEAEMVRAYLDIEKARWQDALVTRVEIDPATRDDRLPQFLLLPLIENAIKYGGRTSPGTLEVAVVIRTAGPSLECIVSNTGTWIESTGERTTTSTHIGLDNLRRRLMRHYGGAATLEIGRRDGWVDVRLRLSRNLDANRAATRSPLP